MLKFVLIGIGFMFLIEGLLYFLFTSNMINMMKSIEKIEKDKIKTIACLASVFGAFLIYFTIKIYYI